MMQHEDANTAAIKPQTAATLLFADYFADVFCLNLRHSFSIVAIKRYYKLCSKYRVKAYVRRVKKRFSW